MPAAMQGKDKLMIMGNCITTNLPDMVLEPVHFFQPGELLILSYHFAIFTGIKKQNDL